jgi:hypothetical protein
MNPGGRMSVTPILRPPEKGIRAMKPDPPFPTPRRLSEYEASGMTVNERLFVSGLMDAFDRATANGNRAEMAEILGQVYLTPGSITKIVDTCLARRGESTRVVQEGWKLT